MKIVCKKDGYVTDKKELRIILDDIADLKSTSTNEDFISFLNNVNSFIETKQCCSVKQKQAIEDCLIKRKIRENWDDIDVPWDDIYFNK